jgi:GNAT superfamily N-acetyltransferase
MMHLRAPRIDELDALSGLCMRSKAVWGYDSAFMEACRSELTLTPDELHSSHLQVAERDGAVVGVVQISVSSGLADLEKLFVEPLALRSGAGRALFAWATQSAKDQGATVLRIDADPGAADFYRRMGARDDGVAASGSIPGRMLPRFKLEL